MTLQAPGVGGGGGPSCGCPDFVVSRRRFLQGLGALSGAGVISMASGSAFLQAALATTPSAAPGNVLVVLSLRGGADGLSLVVPHGEGGDYYDVRHNIAVPKGALIPHDELFGLHPGFQRLAHRWTGGEPRPAECSA